MNDQASPPSPKPGSRRRWWWLPMAVVVPVAMLAGISWHVHRSAPVWTFCRGMEAFAGNDLEGVGLAAEALRGVEGYEPHVRLLEGIVLLRGGRLVEAITAFGAAKDHPDIAALAYALSGEALYKARRLRDADRILTTAVELDPSQTDAHRWLAALYYDVGAMGHALEQLKIVAEQAPADPRPNRARGLIDKDFERYDEAIGEFRESLRRDPDQAGKQEILAEMAECLVKLRRYREAIEALDPCPRSARSLWLQAECSYAQGDKAAAGRDLAEALRLAPKHLDALQLRATIDQEAGDLESAVRALRQAVEYYPKEYKVRYRLAQLYQTHRQCAACTPSRSGRASALPASSTGRSTAARTVFTRRAVTKSSTRRVRNVIAAAKVAGKAGAAAPLSGAPLEKRSRFRSLLQIRVSQARFCWPWQAVRSSG